MAASRSIFILLCTCFAILAFSRVCSLNFQSDELQQEDDEDWGIVGGSPSIIEQVTDRAPPPSSPPPRRPAFRSGDSSSSSPSDSKVQFQLEHSFGGLEFAPAGSFSARLRHLHHGGQTLVKLRLSRNLFTTAEQEAFQALLKDDGFYSVQIPANVLNPGQEMILSSVKARCLAASNLQERFEFYLDKGHVIGIGYGASDCAYPRTLKYPTQWKFDSHIVMKSTEQAVRSLPVVTEPEVELGEDGQPKKQPEKSFWAKYWMYIVPLGLIILNAITQVANMPDEPGQGGPAQGNPQRTVGAARRR